MANSPGGQSCRGVVIYEDRPTRDHALRLCDNLARKFWPDLELDFLWWKFDYLEDADLGRFAADTASESDLVIFSAHAAKELPTGVRTWIESWVNRRLNKPNALVALIGLAEDQTQGLSPIHVYLREVARHAGMDYLPHLSGPAIGKLDTTTDGIATRADRVTSLLDNVLHRPTAPSRWGINE
jgi:hypothetical protein